MRSSLFEVGDGGRWIYRFPTNPTLLLLTFNRLWHFKGAIAHPLTSVFVPDSALGLLPSIALSSGQAVAKSSRAY